MAATSTRMSLGVVLPGPWLAGAAGLAVSDTVKTWKNVYWLLSRCACLVSFGRKKSGRYNPVLRPLGPVVSAAGRRWVGGPYGLPHEGPACNIEKEAWPSHVSGQASELKTIPDVTVQ